MAVQYANPNLHIVKGELAFCRGFFILIFCSGGGHIISLWGLHKCSLSVAAASLNNA